MSNLPYALPSPAITSGEISFEDALSQGERWAEDALARASLASMENRRIEMLSERFGELIQRAQVAAEKPPAWRWWAHRPAADSGAEALGHLLASLDVLDEMNERVTRATEGYAVISERLFALSDLMGSLRFMLAQEHRVSPEMMDRFDRLGQATNSLGATRRYMESSPSRPSFLRGGFSTKEWITRVSACYQLVRARLRTPLESLPEFRALQRRGLALA